MSTWKTHNESYTIEQYLQGKLDRDALIGFEKQLQSDKVLAMEIRKHAFVEAMLFQQGLLDCRNALKQYHKQKQFNKKLRKGLLVTGIVALAIGALWANSKPPQMGQPVEAVTETVPIKEALPVIDTLPALDTDIYIEDNIQTDLQETVPKPITRTPQAIIEFSSKQSKLSTSFIEEQLIASKKVVIVESIKDSCISFDGFVEIHATPSCTHETNGQIEIRLIQDPTSPINPPIQLADSFLNSSCTKKGCVVSGLPSQWYSLTISDATPCTYEFTTYVDQKNCNAYKAPPTFYPKRNAYWEVVNPFSDNSLAITIQLFNRGGKLMYEASQSNSASIRWDGKSVNGQLLPIGPYHYVIAQTNGAEVLKGNVLLGQ